MHTADLRTKPSVHFGDIGILTHRRPWRTCVHRDRRSARITNIVESILTNVRRLSSVRGLYPSPPRSKQASCVSAAGMYYQHSINLTQLMASLRRRRCVYVTFRLVSNVKRICPTVMCTDGGRPPGNDGAASSTGSKRVLGMLDLLHIACRTH